MDWEYFKIAPHREVHFIDYGKNEFELVNLVRLSSLDLPFMKTLYTWTNVSLQASNGYRPNVVNTQIDGRDAYASSDLVSPHPSKPGYWKVVGRTDDQLIHSTGEKTNPGPLGKLFPPRHFEVNVAYPLLTTEGTLSRDPHVQACVVFGRSRFHCGVIVQPKAQYAFDPADEDKLADFRNRLWSVMSSVSFA